MSAMWVFLGGGVGAVLRWVLSALLPVPWGTALVNVLGSFLLALIAHPSMGLTDNWRLGLAVGTLGAFTTYSTFNLELLEALQVGDLRRAGLQVAVTLGGALLAGVAGWSLAGWLAK